MSSNFYNLKEWAKSRVKRLDFDVHFSPNETHKEKLATLFSYPSSIFRWFSFLYFQQLEKDGALKEDELGVAREVMKALYLHAQRPIPSFFPMEPIEKLYDPGLRSWKDLLNRLKKATLKTEGDRLQVVFSEDFQHHEIKEYQGSLPQTIKYKLRGKTLIIESPDDFKTWLYGQNPELKPWYLRFWKKKS